MYFGEGDECHMAFHFPLMPRMYMSIATRGPLSHYRHLASDSRQFRIACQWAIFVRNHDELSLDMVTDSERDYLWQVYAADRRARINLGIRRRLAPLLEGDRRRVELMNSLLLSMPGPPSFITATRSVWATTFIWATAMASARQCNGRRTATAASLASIRRRLCLPAAMDPLYGYGVVNVEAQRREPIRSSTGHGGCSRSAAAIPLGRGSLHVAFPKEPQNSGISSRIRRRHVVMRCQSRPQSGSGRA